ncbi:protein EMSY-LIKE 3-like [Curcuma longa]|uniref:protein EMSY-LIKE 3-like n=1 Tax=Curcuma longa TaxID=136217 RepID=UPI003D9EA351
MDYGPTDSSGTDDDLPPYFQNRGAAARPVAAGGKSNVGALPPSRVQNDMESLIHQLEQEAYCSVLRAFKAQSDAITWEKEGLITELRKELRLTNEEHRELLHRVNVDDNIRRIREWRQAGGVQTSLVNNAQTALDVIPSPTVSASQKRRKTSNSAAALSMGGSLPVPHSQPGAVSLHPSASTAKQGNIAGARGKKTKPNPPGSIGRDQVKNIAAESADVAANASLVGQKVMTRWPDDNNFYEAVITDYKPHEGLHALVYDMDTEDETWEWVNLNEIAPEDIRWADNEPGKSKPGDHHRPGLGSKKSRLNGISPGFGRGRGPKNQFSKNYMSSQNWSGKKGFQNITILDTKVIVRDVERILDISPPDHQEIEKAKKLLKKHEQSLVEAIAKLDDNMSNSENEEDDQLSHRQTKERGLAWTDWPRRRKKEFHLQGMLEGGGGPDGDHIVGDGTASNYHRDDYYGI